MNKEVTRSVGALLVSLLFATGLALAKTEKKEVDITQLSRVETIRDLKPGTYTKLLSQRYS